MRSGASGTAVANPHRRPGWSRTIVGIPPFAPRSVRIDCGGSPLFFLTVRIDCGGSPSCRRTAQHARPQAPVTDRARRPVTLATRRACWADRRGLGVALLTCRPGRHAFRRRPEASWMGRRVVGRRHKSCRSVQRLVGRCPEPCLSVRRVVRTNGPAARLDLAIPRHGRLPTSSEEVSCKPRTSRSGPVPKRHGGPEKARRFAQSQAE